MSDLDLCSFIKAIQKDPKKKVEGLTIRKIKQLQEHLKVCNECLRVTDEILEAGKNVPEDLNSEWKGQNITKMSNFSQGTYQKMFDILLSEELCYEASAATENNIKRAMKLILGRAIKTGVIKNYSNLVLDENLNIHFTIFDPMNDKFELILYYGK